MTVNIAACQFTPMDDSVALLTRPLSPTQPIVLLDTRNRGQVRHGSFAGALTLPIENFTDLSDAIAAQGEALAGAAVVSLCPGAIRCEKAALQMQANGIDNAMPQDGGIVGYFEQIGDCGYDDGCLIFNEHVALGPVLCPIGATVAAVPPK